MPRTTLDVDPIVLREIRRRAELEGKSMGRVASELLARAMRDRDSGEPSTPFRWRSADLGQPRVDLDDSEAVRRALDEAP